MQIMDVYVQCVLVHPQVLVVFISFSSCLGAWEQQTPPRCSPAPSQAHPPTGTPSPHPLFNFPINIPFLLLIGFYSHSWFAAGTDRDRMLPICSWISAHTNPGALSSRFPHGAAGGWQFPTQGDETLQSSHHSRQQFLPPAFPQPLTFCRQWAGIAARGSVSRIPMDVGIDPFILSCLLIPGSSQGMALPKQGSGFTTSLEWLIYPQTGERAVAFPC